MLSESAKSSLIEACEAAGDKFAADEVRRGAPDARATVIRRMESVFATRSRNIASAWDDVLGNTPAYVVAARRAISIAKSCTL